MFRCRGEQRKRARFSPDYQRHRFAADSVGREIPVLKFALALFFLVSTASSQKSAQKTKLLVLSVDGLDNRYLQNASEMGLKIPNIRRLMREGSWASGGVTGEVPTVTWPSHTTLLTGVPPRVHGILGNQKPGVAVITGRTI